MISKSPLAKAVLGEVGKIGGALALAGSIYLVGKTIINSFKGRPSGRPGDPQYITPDIKGGGGGIGGGTSGGEIERKDSKKTGPTSAPDSPATTIGEQVTDVLGDLSDSEDEGGTQSEDEGGTQTSKNKSKSKKSRAKRTRKPKAKKGMLGKLGKFGKGLFGKIGAKGLGNLPPDEYFPRTSPLLSPVILSAMRFASLIFTFSCLAMICKLFPCTPQAKQMKIFLSRLAVPL